MALVAPPFVFSYYVARIWISCFLTRCTRWSSCLRYSATSRKVAVSIPDGVTGIFHWRHPYGSTMTLESIQLLTKMSTWISHGVKGGRCLGLITLLSLCASTSLNTQNLYRDCCNPSIGLPFGNRRNWPQKSTLSSEPVVYFDIVPTYFSTVVKVLCYKLEVHWFDSRWCHWNFSLTSFRSHYGPG